MRQGWRGSQDDRVRTKFILNSGTVYNSIGHIITNSRNAKGMKDKSCRLWLSCVGSEMGDGDGTPQRRWEAKKSALGGLQTPWKPDLDLPNVITKLSSIANIQVIIGGYTH